MHASSIKICLQDIYNMLYFPMRWHSLSTEYQRISILHYTCSVHVAFERARPVLLLQDTLSLSERLLLQTILNIVMVDS